MSWCALKIYTCIIHRPGSLTLYSWAMLPLLLKWQGWGFFVVPREWLMKNLTIFSCLKWKRKTIHSQVPPKISLSNKFHHNLNPLIRDTMQKPFKSLQKFHQKDQFCNERSLYTPCIQWHILECIYQGDLCIISLSKQTWVQVYNILTISNMEIYKPFIIFDFKF